MKVEGSGNLRGSSTVRRTGRSEGTGGGSFAKQLTNEAETTPAQGVAPTAAAHGVSGVLALQEVDDATARASRGKMRAQEMLDKMEEIRHGILSGALPRDKVMELSRIVQSRRVHVDDPRLAEILDEIDLRAQVELAKLQS
ncbi:flagellar assembly protein FliX [Azospirillum sp. ST 5-10]|uniref:flagellar assembly protein FliX n=1 Tax=unclassified Azospirillum TaxID=2630922 RepID=UPI003F4A6F2E